MREPVRALAPVSPIEVKSRSVSLENAATSDGTVPPRVFPPSLSTSSAEASGERSRRVSGRGGPARRFWRESGSSLRFGCWSAPVRPTSDRSSNVSLVKITLLIVAPHRRRPARLSTSSELPMRCPPSEVARRAIASKYDEYAVTRMLKLSGRWRRCVDILFVRGASVGGVPAGLPCSVGGRRGRRAGHAQPHELESADAGQQPESE